MVLDDAGVHQDDGGVRRARQEWRSPGQLRARRDHPPVAVHDLNEAGAQPGRPGVDRGRGVAGLLPRLAFRGCTQVLPDQGDDHRGAGQEAEPDHEHGEHGQPDPDRGEHPAHARHPPSGSSR